jgi:ubiquinone/menaquinone biosynthesis C-methylase UbiE
VTLVKASICQLPEELPLFDRIFCISTLEHLCAKDQKDTITEFARFLAPNGLLVLTVDYPEVTPTALIELADSVGLVPAGDVILDQPTKDSLTNGHLSIYRCVFTHKRTLNNQPSSSGD